MRLIAVVLVRFRLYNGMSTFWASFHAQKDRLWDHVDCIQALEAVLRDARLN